MGLLYSCNDPLASGKKTCLGNFTIQDDFGTNVTIDREWSNAWPNFDNVGNTFLICFILVTLNGYTSTMIRTMNAPKVTIQ